MCNVMQVSSWKTWNVVRTVVRRTAWKIASVFRYRCRRSIRCTGVRSTASSSCDRCQSQTKTASQVSPFHSSLYSVICDV